MHSVRALWASMFAFSCLAPAAPAAAAGSVDAGRTWFEGVCFNCHFEPATGPRFVAARFNPAYLTSAFERTPAMNANLLLLNAQAIDDIASYLGLVGLGLPNANDTDRLLDWGEDTFPQLLSPSRPATQQFSGYTYRFYPLTGIYVGTKDNNVWLFDGRTAGAAIQHLGALRSYLEQMPNGR